MNAKWGCDGKIKFKSARLAKIAARRQPNRAWYFCDNCHYYHAGSINV